MTDDLIARLRETKPRYDQNTGELLYHVFCNRDGEEAADALEVMREHADAMAKALSMSHALLGLIEQRSACNTWWVNADDPETACGDTYHAVEQSLTAYRTAFPETAP